MLYIKINKKCIFFESRLVFALIKLKIYLHLQEVKVYIHKECVPLRAHNAHNTS